MDTYLPVVQEQLNEPGGSFLLNTNNTAFITYDQLAEPSYGRMVRIPTLSGPTVVTVKEARRMAKDYRKAAKRIERVLD